MTPQLFWEEANRTEVRSVEELDRLVDQLTVEARADMPLTVELHVGDETAMSIVVGREESHVEFHSAATHPPIVACHGPWNDDELIEFSHRGQYSELPRRYFVPIADAREALRRYFRTGTRPDNIAWSYD